MERRFRANTVPLIRLALAAFILAWSTGCLPHTTSAPTPTSVAATRALPSPTPLEPTPTPARPRAIMVSLDGAREDYVRRFIADGTMPHLASLARRGVMAEYARTIDPSLTAAAHVSIGTGAYPHRTDVVSNKFHRPQDDFYWYTDGFQAEISVEPIWRAAMRQGLKTAALFWVGAQPDFPDQLADYTVAYGKCEVYSALHELSFALASGWKNAPPSFSPPLESVLDVLGRYDARVARLYVLAVDSTDDGQANYDVLILDDNKEIEPPDSPQSAYLRLGEWAPLEISSRIHSGAYFKLKAITTTVGTAPLQALVFRSRVCYNQASPPQLLRDVNQRFGFFPASPDYYALEHGWIDEEDYMHMAEVQSRWMMEVTAYVYDTYKPDLLLTWQGPVDSAGHQFLLVDKRQAGYDEERASRYAELYRRAYQLVDENLGLLLEKAEPDGAAFFLFSDHGMAPIHTKVYVNTILQRAGLLVFKGPPSYYVNVTRSKALAFTSGGSAHIYINLKGRERPGIVPQEEYDEVVRAVIEALTETRDPETGEQVFCRIVRRPELEQLKLDSRYSGDVFVQACPGYVLTDWRGSEVVFEPTTYYGQHGYDSTLPEMHAFFIAMGPGLKEGATIGPVHLVDVVPTVARFLGIEPPPTAEGRVLVELWP